MEYSPKTNIEIWWEYVFKLGQHVQNIENQPEDNEIDGRAIWGGVECQVISTNIEGLRYNESLLPIYEHMDKICESHKMTEGDREFNPKYHHFYMQLKNLVVKKSNWEIKLNRLLQLAYNAGQLSKLIELGKIPEDIKKCFEDHNLHLLDTYVSKENQTIINERYLNKTHLDKVRGLIHMLGGANIQDKYYSKYLKYKYKYLMEKKLILNKNKHS